MRLSSRKITDSFLSGFNGVPQGFPHPEVCIRKELGIPSGEKLDLCPCAHAESNAIDNAARVGTAIKGSIMYCTTKPCVFCIGRIANAGIKKVVYDQHYDHDLTDRIAEYGQVELCRHHSKN